MSCLSEFTLQSKPCELSVFAACPLLGHERVKRQGTVEIKNDELHWRLQLRTLKRLFDAMHSPVNFVCPRPLGKVCQCFVVLLSSAQRAKVSILRVYLNRIGKAALCTRLPKTSLSSGNSWPHCGRQDRPCPAQGPYPESLARHTLCQGTDLRQATLFFVEHSATSHFSGSRATCDLAAAVDLLRVAASTLEVCAYVIDEQNLLWPEGNSKGLSLLIYCQILHRNSVMHSFATSPQRIK